MNHIRTILVASALAFVASGASAADQTWKIQTNWNPNDQPFPFLQQWGKDVGVMTGGRLEMEALTVNSLVQYNETVDAIGMGVIDGHASSPEYSAGKDPVFAMVGNMVTAYDHPSEADKMMNEYGGLDVYREIMKRYNGYVVGVYFSGLEAFPSAVPIMGPADFKGVKLRAPEGMAHALFQALGAAPVNLPVSEVYTSFERGVIDAADYNTLVTNDQLGLHKFAKYPIYPGIHSMVSNDIVVNLDKWNALPDDIKAILKGSVRLMAIKLWNAVDTADRKVAAKLKADPSVTVVDWPLEERNKLRQVAQGIWADYAKKSPDCQKWYDLVMNYLKTEGKI